MRWGRQRRCASRRPWPRGSAHRCWRCGGTDALLLRDRPPARDPGSRRVTRLRVSLRVPVGRPLPELADFVARCEAAGFDGVGIHDHPSSGRDAYVALALAARATRRLTLFPATSSPIVRHPLLLASLAHSLEELAPGRARLTMAPGFISTRSIGKPRGTVAAMREAPRRAPAARGRGGRLRADRDAAAEPQRGPHAGVPA